MKKIVFIGICMVLLFSCEKKQIVLLPVKADVKLDSIESYKVYASFIDNPRDSDDYVVLRKFVNKSKEGSDTLFFAVNPHSLKTCLLKAETVKAPQSKMENICSIFKGSRYVKLWKVAYKNNNKEANAGLIRIDDASGVFLTIDLCPSRKKMDAYFFSYLLKNRKDTTKAFPLVASVSGWWILKHKEELSLLKEQIAEHRLDITFANHTFNHNYVHDIPNEENFMLLPKTDVKLEVLETEKIMLKNGILPSVFFRFPGLISNKKIFNQVQSYGLIPIGAQAWIAKGEIPKKGSLILVHGNGNETIGLEMFMNSNFLKKFSFENLNNFN